MERKISLTCKICHTTFEVDRYAGYLDRGSVFNYEPTANRVCACPKCGNRVYFNSETLRQREKSAAQETNEESKKRIATVWIVAILAWVLMIIAMVIVCSR